MMTVEQKVFTGCYSSVEIWTVTECGYYCACTANHNFWYLL